METVLRNYLKCQHVRWTEKANELRTNKWPLGPCGSGLWQWQGHFPWYHRAKLEWSGLEPARTLLVPVDSKCKQVYCKLCHGRGRSPATRGEGWVQEHICDLLKTLLGRKSWRSLGSHKKQTQKKECTFGQKFTNTFWITSPDKTTNEFKFQKTVRK